MWFPTLSHDFTRPLASFYFEPSTPLQFDYFYDLGCGTPKIAEDEAQMDSLSGQVCTFHGVENVSTPGL